MKFVVTGAAGNVSKPLAELLLEKGHDVTVIGRNRANIEPLIAKGAKAAIGDFSSPSFLAETFKGADGVYLMLPPMWDADDQKKLSVKYGESFASALRSAKVPNVVFLSSYGAHRHDDAGPISGMGLVEEILNTLDGVNVLNLRTAYFYTNLLLSIGLIQKAGHMGNMFVVPDGKFTVVDPYDIAKVAAEALDRQNFKGHSFQYVISDMTGTDEIARLIGKEIGIPDLRWKKKTAADFKKVLLGYGFAEGAANDYVALLTTLASGKFFEHIEERKPKVEGTTIEQFAKTFAAAYADHSS